MAIVNSRAAIEPKTGKAAIFVNETIPSLMRKLFSNGEQGFFYDPNDLTTLYQDAAGTSPVTAAGQPVGLMRDKSGRNNHAFQTVSASRPILRKNAVTGANYLEFDGVDDFLQTSNIDFTTTDEVSLFSCSINLSTAEFQTMVELGDNHPTGTFLLRCPQSASKPNYLSRGTATAEFRSTASSNVLSGTVLSCVSKISTDTLRIRFNGFENSSNANQGTGNYGNYPLYIGSRGGTSYQFRGQIYGLIGVGRLTTISEVAAIEKEFAKRVGATLNV